MGTQFSEFLALTIVLWPSHFLSSFPYHIIVFYTANPTASLAIMNSPPSSLCQGDFSGASQENVHLWVDLPGLASSLVRERSCARPGCSAVATTDACLIHILLNDWDLDTQGSDLCMTPVSEYRSLAPSCPNLWCMPQNKCEPFIPVDSREPHHFPTLPLVFPWPYMKKTHQVHQSFGLL